VLIHAFQGMVGYWEKTQKVFEWLHSLPHWKKKTNDSGTNLLRTGYVNLRILGQFRENTGQFGRNMSKARPG